jgi:carbamoyl-phosphate synthase small subunit
VGWSPAFCYLCGAKKALVTGLERKPAVLLLEDGTVFQGKAAGAIGTAFGEICFNTGMTGYQEVFTDPSYFGQLMVMTNAHIGNYGARDGETESESIKIAGLICKNFTNEYSRPVPGAGPLQDYLQDEGTVAISDVDTRLLVRHIRSRGAMNAVVSSEILDLEVLRERLMGAPDMNGLELASKVTCDRPYYYGHEDARYHVAALDFGIKKNILRCFDGLDVYVKIFPAQTPFEELKAWNPDGYFLSNGPGDPASMDYAVETAKAILAENKPLFGICLGHQLLALALGIPTYKMHHGHRGINHPVKNLLTDRSEITSQNHGFAVDPEAIRAHAATVEVTHVNLNDETIEGIRVIGRPAFSVQYHPEASPGPHDSRYLFEDFVRLMRQSR